MAKKRETISLKVIVDACLAAIGEHGPNGDFVVTTPYGSVYADASMFDASGRIKNANAKKPPTS